ncbi:MAG: zinc ribbon domain-containing protein [Desulfofustis sp.]|nr:zinc ribbon domain-containing protein [Desulfofustis sp.]
MPIYEFICTSCGHQFETICSSTDTSSVTCAKCRSSAVKKILSTGTFKVGKSGSAGLPAAPACGRSGFS